MKQINMFKKRDKPNPFFINGERAMVSLGPLSETVHCSYRCAFCYVQDGFSSYVNLDIDKIIDFLKKNRDKYNIIYVSGDTDSFAPPRTQQGLSLLNAIVKEVYCDLEFSSRAVFSEQEYYQLEDIINEQKKKNYRFYAGVSITRYTDQLSYLEPYPIPSPDARIIHMKKLKSIGAITMLGLRPFLPIVNVNDYLTILDKIHPDLDIALGEYFYFIRNGKIQSRVFPKGIPSDIEKNIVRNQIMNFDDNTSLWDIWNSEDYEHLVAEHCKKLGIVFSMHSAEAIEEYKKLCKKK
jgi:DNA repair photolyase